LLFSELLIARVPKPQKRFMRTSFTQQKLSKRERKAHVVKNANL
jgi:hypothetical protein